MLGNQPMLVFFLFLIDGFCWLVVFLCVLLCDFLSIPPLYIGSTVVWTMVDCCLGKAIAPFM